MSDDVRDLADTTAADLPLVGGKAANLGELMGLEGVRVPDGFSVTTLAYDRAVGHDPAVTALLDELAAVSADDDDALESLGARLREAIETIAIPDQLQADITEALARHGEAEPYAVRSSATAEDLPTASFAGQQDTYLNITGTEQILTHVRRCWASLFTDRAIAYRSRQGLDHRRVSLAVVVQRLIASDASGIAFTADPLTQDRRIVSIDAGLGLGEAMVSGLADVDNYRVRGGEIVSRRIGTQALAVRGISGGGTEEVAVDPTRGAAPALTDTQILRLAQTARRVEQHFGRPQDIEYAFAGDDLYLVQSRPITTLFPVPAATDGKNHVYLSMGHQQMMTDAMTPLGLSFFADAFADVTLHAAGGRLFGDLAPNLASPVGRRIALASLGRLDPLMLGAVQTLVERKDFMAGLAHDGQRFITPKGSGYFTWRLPVEAVRLFRSRDGVVVTALRAHQEEGVAALRAHLPSLSGAALFEAIDADLQELRAQMYDPTGMAAIYVGLYAISWLNSHVRRWLGDAGAGDALTRGITDDPAAAMGRATLEVAGVIREHPPVRAALPGLPDEGFLDAVAEIGDGGPQVAAALREFLDRYGMRCPGEIDITRPRWSEQPSLLVPVLVQQADTEAGADREDGPAQAEALRRDLLSRLAEQPGGRSKARRTDRMIERLRAFVGYREQPKYLMMRHYAIIKQALLTEAGRLTEAGILQRPDDAYFLSVAEFRAASAGTPVDAETIQRRRERFQLDTELTPPRIYTSDGEVVTGSYAHHDLPDGALAGIAASAGQAEGIARVVLDPARARLTSDDILVTTYTDPSWTPLFLSVKAVVTEVGGAMTHGAVVAREYGLPAVVGVEGATGRIADGRRIRVNGDEGWVELLD